MIHPAAWLVWLAGALIALSTTRNPYYLATLLGGIGFVTTGLRRRTESLAPIPLSPVRFGVVVVVLAAGFNAATVHVGRHVLFRLPAGIPLLGGAVTLEAAVYGALNGVVLAGIFGAFAVLNMAVPVRSLVRFIPRAFYPVAVVVSIALTFVPTTLRHFREIREAQAIRGHRLRGLRDWLPLFMPLLIGGLERALQLAEAMTARGFASGAERVGNPGARLLIIEGLAGLLIGWMFQLVWQEQAVGTALMVLGATLVVLALWLIGRRVPRTTYRREPWQAHDTLVALGGMLAAAVFMVPVPGLDRKSIFFYPYPALIAPRFDPTIGLALLGLLVPPILEVRARLRARAAAGESGAEVPGDGDEVFRAASHGTSEGMGTSEACVQEVRYGAGGGQ
jgi:energy-coupling factor transport system permease protein